MVAQWLTNPTKNHEVVGSVSALAQRVKDPVLSLLWHGFDPWPRNVQACHGHGMCVYRYVYMEGFLFLFNFFSF